MTREKLEQLRSEGFLLDPKYDKLVPATPQNTGNQSVPNANIKHINCLKFDPFNQNSNKLDQLVLDILVEPSPTKVTVNYNGKTQTAFSRGFGMGLLGNYMLYIDHITVPTPSQSTTIQFTVNAHDASDKVIDTKTLNYTFHLDGKINKVGGDKELIANEGKSINLITIQQLMAIGVSKKLALKYIDALNVTLNDYEINTPLRICHFLAQVLHESGRLNFTYEKGKTDADYKGFKGRGLLMLTTQRNYKNYGIYEKEDFTSSTKNKEKLEILPYSTRSAGWFWSIYKMLNYYADQNDFIYCTYVINGGFNGFDDRLEIIIKAYKIYKIEYKGFSIKESKINNSPKACFAWGLWHDYGITSKNFNTCKNDKAKAVEGYKRFLELVPEDFEGNNWYSIHLMSIFSNLKYIKNNKSIVNETDAAKQRLLKLEEI